MDKFHVQCKIAPHWSKAVQLYIMSVMNYGTFEPQHNISLIIGEHTLTVLTNYIKIHVACTYNVVIKTHHLLAGLMQHVCASSLKKLTDKNRIHISHMLP